MPATLSYPGVYIEEIPSGVRTITGVSTSVAAFLGRASKGPLDKAVRLLSLSDFERNFGEPESRSELPPNLSEDKAAAVYPPMFVPQHSMLVDSQLSLSDASYALAAAGYSQSRRPIPADDKSTLEGALSGLWSGAAKSFRLSVDG